MPTQTEEHTKPNLNVTRTPVGPSNTGKSDTVGDIAVRDAICVIGACWLVVFVLYFSLARHNA